MVRKQYDLDTQARARGEDVPERPAANYSQDLVSPRLLCAVLPDGAEADLDEVKRDADSVYKAPTKASRAQDAIEAGHDQDEDEDEHEHEVAQPQVASVEPVVGNTDDAPFMDISAFVPGDYAAQTEYTHNVADVTQPESSHEQQVVGDQVVPPVQDEDEEEQGLDFNAVFDAGAAVDDSVVIKDETSPRIETVATEGVSADGNMAYSYSSTTMVYGEAQPQQVQDPVGGAKIEEIPDEPQHDDHDDEEEEDDEDDDEEEVVAGHGNQTADVDADSDTQ